MFRERMKNISQEVREDALAMSAIRAGRIDTSRPNEYGVKSPFVVHGIAAYERAFKTWEATLAEGNGPGFSVLIRR